MKTLDKMRGPYGPVYNAIETFLKAARTPVSFRQICLDPSIAGQLAALKLQNPTGLVSDYFNSISRKVVRRWPIRAFPDSWRKNHPKMRFLYMWGANVKSGAKLEDILYSDGTPKADRPAPMPVAPKPERKANGLHRRASDQPSTALDLHVDPKAKTVCLHLGNTEIRVHVS